MDLISIVPLLVIFGSNFIFPVRRDNYRPSFQPPNFIFPIIWVYIAISMGLVRGNTRISNYLFFSILILFVLWTILQYYENYGYSFLTLLVVTCISIVYMVTLSREIGDHKTFYLLPLPVWLVIASTLSGTIYENER